MNDAHVVSLVYDVQRRSTVDFDKAPPLAIEGPSCTIVISEYRAVLTMTDHFASVGEARAAVEPFLRGWEFIDDLTEGNGLRFAYASARLVDRKPDPNAGPTFYGEAAMTVIASVVATGHVSRGAWPKPAKDVEVSAEVEILRQRWLNYVEGRELLTSAAYFAVTVLEASSRVATAGKRNFRQAAATHYNIELAVLAKLGELTAGKGGDEARKAGGLGIPLSGDEQNWIRTAFKALVLQAARRAHHGAPPPTRLTMADLPLL